MSAYDLSTVVMAVCAVAAVVAGIIAWFYHRGGSEREFTLALKANTEATGRLTAAFYSFRSEVVDELHEHDIRLTKLEAER